jgi:ribosomal protein L11 methyltransferase
MWIKVSVKTRPEALAALEAAFLDYASGTVQEGTKEEPVIAAYFPATLAAELEARIEGIRAAGLDPGRGLLEKELIKEENWSTEWKKYYHPLSVGTRFLICPSWELRTEEGRFTLALDPGQAFGTGYHPTTQLCLELLENTEPGTFAYDLGTGSGILAIALAKLGADVVAFEADPVAIDAAKENAARNGTKIRLRQVDLLSWSPPERGAPLAVANLTADLFVSLAPKLPSYVLPGGKLIAGGINCQRQAEVEAAFRKAGFAIQDVLRRQEWVCLVGGRS